MSTTSNLIQKNKDFLGYFTAAFAGVMVQYLVGTTLLVNHLNWPITKAFWVGYLVSIPVGFILTKLLAFNAKHSGKARRELTKYLITIIISGCITVYGAQLSIYVLNSITKGTLITIPFTNYRFSPAGTIGHFMGMGMSFIFNFIAHKRFTFKQTGLLDKLKAFLGS